jgi:hypothetical protein
MDAKPNHLLKVKQFKIRTLSSPDPGHFHTTFSYYTGVTPSSESYRREALRNTDMYNEIDSHR